MMDELNALNAPKKVVDGLVEVFDGLAQMFAGVSEQLDMLAANAKTEDELELPVAEQPVLPVTEKKGPAVSHPRKKPVKKTKKVESKDRPVLVGCGKGGNAGVQDRKATGDWQVGVRVLFRYALDAAAFWKKAGVSEAETATEPLRSHEPDL